MFMYQLEDHLVRFSQIDWVRSSVASHSSLRKTPTLYGVPLNGSTEAFLAYNHEAFGERLLLLDHLTVDEIWLPPNPYQHCLRSIQNLHRFYEPGSSK